MQDYEQYTRISRAPVILPPAGGTAQPEQDAPPPPPEAEEAAPAPDLVRMVPRRAARRKPTPADRLLLVQWAVCGLILAAFLFLKSADPAMYEDLRGWYNGQMSRVITVQTQPPAESQ